MFFLSIYFHLQISALSIRISRTVLTASCVFVDNQLSFVSIDDHLSYVLIDDQLSRVSIIINILSLGFS